MPDSVRAFVARQILRLPLQFRVLYRLFLLRIVDFEALSIQADIPRFLGQFAGVLIMISLLWALGALLGTISGPPRSAELLHALEWHTEQSLISMTMLVVGIIAVITWDSTFPDRRDIMVLAPLPVKPSTILSAKVAATASLLGIAILSLNFASSVAWPLVLVGLPAAFRFVAAYWITILLAAVFLYGTLLALQGLTALLLPRRLLLRISALMQLAAFALVLGVYFLEPSLDTPAAMADPSTQYLLRSSPVLWFFALFNQLNGSLPATLQWVAQRAWFSIAIAVPAASASLVLCYLHTMKKTVEEPDMIPASRGSRRAVPLGSPLSTAVLQFTFRSLTRSRHHRVVFAFYLALASAIAFSDAGALLSHAASRAINPGFLATNFLLMSLVILGLRSTFSLPISLSANWVLRLTQLAPPQPYIAASRRALLLFAVLPAFLVSACLSLAFRPLSQVTSHLAIMALLGVVISEATLIGFRKIPFTCSYLPGKVNVQFAFWGGAVLLGVFAISFAEVEMDALNNGMQRFILLASLAALAIGLQIFNRNRAKDAVLYFEDLPPVDITTLGLLYIPPAPSVPADPSPS